MNAVFTNRNKSFALGWSMTAHSAIMYFITAALVADGLNIIIPSFEAAHGFTRGQMNLAAAFGGWSMVISAYLFAWLVMRKGPKKVTIVSLLLIGMSVISLGRSTTIVGFSVCILSMAFLSNGIGWTTTNTLVSNWFIKKRGIAFGIATMGLPLATAVLVPVANFLVQQFGIRQAFLIMGIAVILMAPATWVWIRDTPEEAGLAPDGDILPAEEVIQLREKMIGYQSAWTIGRLLKNKDAWLISLSYGLLFLVTAGIVSQLVPRLMDKGYSIDQAVGFLSAAALIGIPGSYLWGWLDQKFGVRKASAIYCIWYLVATVFLLMDGGKTTMIVAIFFIGIALGGIGNLYPSMVAYTFGRHEFASVNRVVNVLVSIIRPLGFVVMGAAYDITHSYDTGYKVLIGVALVTIVLVSMIKNRHIPQ